MYCLWNEEYGEHDLTHIAGLEDILKLQAESYKKYRGMIVGDYEVLDVEYDWGKRDQRWKVRCVRCHKIVYQYHTKDWRRGKGCKTTCNCDRDLRKALIEISKEKAAERREFNRLRQIGKVYGDWEIIEYNGYQKCTIRCTTCGKTKSYDIKYDDVVTGKIKPCNHPNDYSGDEWIGKRNGHLTVIGRNGKFFIARCDCGNEITVKPTFMFTYKNRKDCGMPDCPYSTPLERKSRERRAKGFEFERQVEQNLIAKGYNAVKTQDQADYGVDIIIQEDEGNIAVQCKKQDDPSGIEAVQAVYAGGRYYDCTKFAVISPSGFSNPAIIMAKKLGVYLCKENHKFHYPEDINEYAATLLPIKFNNAKLEKLYEIDGEKHTLSDWCLIYNISNGTVRKRLKAGITLKTALETPCKTTRGEIYTVHNYTGNIADICRHFNVSEPYVRYRMTTNKMSLEDAIFQPKKAIGRPKKSDHSKEDDKQIIMQGF